MEMNTIFLNRKMKVVLDKKKLDKVGNKVIIATMLKNIESLGFTFSKKVIKSLSSYLKSDIESFYFDILIDLKKMVGANVSYKPMYANFPEQVMMMDEAELYINAITHYVDSILLGTPDPWLPEYPVEKRPKLKGNAKLRVIDLGTEEEFFDIFKGLFNSKVAMSPTDREDIEWVLMNHKGKALDLLPEIIPNKENLAFIIKTFRKNDLLSDGLLKKYFKTATDVLRLATAFSGGDVSLADNTKFISFKRSDRKLILRIMESLSTYIQEDMLRHKNKWIRLGERLHPGEFSSRFPKTYKAFKDIREDEPIVTFNGSVEECFQTNNIKELLALLSSRPGEFARKLDRMLRGFIGDKSKTVLNKFEEVAEKVSSTVLMQVRAHFINRNNQPFRSFFPKGSVANVMTIDNQLPPYKAEVCDRVVEICDNALMKIFEVKGELGKVYVDEALKECTVPFALRSASKSFKTISRGSRITLEPGNTIRLFMHWKNIGSTEPSDDKNAKRRDTSGYYSHEDESGRVDLDLSAVFLNDKFDNMGAICYYDLRNEQYKACHSGDITSAPRGASEFIDIDIKSALKYGARYVVMSVNSYTHQMFKDIPECYAGCMMRTNNNSGEIYEPSTVNNKFDLTAESKIAIPLIFDLLERKLIWCDVSMHASMITSNYGNNVGANNKGVIAMAKTFAKINKPNLYDLFVLHAKSRGKLVKDKDKADFVFSLHKGDVTAYDIEKITSEYL